jgi:hypothetical protein
LVVREETILRGYWSVTTVMCYTAAIPFFRNSLLGDMAYAVALFGGFALLENFVVSLQEKQQTVTA